MAADHERVKALFLAAIERDDPTDRREFLHDEVGEDAELRDRLHALLAAYDQPLGALDRPLAGEPETTAALDASRSASIRNDGLTRGQSNDNGPSLIDTVIADRYKIRQEIGEGGMGTVYLAEQLRPVRRQVALKLIKPGMDSRNVLARFDSERQALALMEHPHIARVLDAGTTADGRPYFVMELVKGIPITKYCDVHRLDIPARLALFRQVCSAVQHAHQKGIIHRDLKPSNILVEAHDDKPVPKVIDFGLAKATSGIRLTEQSLFTAFGSVAGTPLYMAPEQAAFNALDVDTRADIYALGVILYELLDRLDADPPRIDPAGGAGRDAAVDTRGRAADSVEPDQHVGGAAVVGGEPPGRAGAAIATGAGRVGLDRDEGAGQGAGAAVRLGRRSGRRRRAVPQPRAGLGRAADGGLPAEEVRPPQPGPGDGGGAGARGAGAGRGRHDPGTVRGPTAGAEVCRPRQRRAGREAAGAGHEDERDPGLDLQGPRPQERRRRTASRCRRCWASGSTGRRPKSRGRRPATRSPWPACS